MKRLLVFFISVFALVVASPAMADTKTVQITRSGFVPTAVTVQQGDTVTWKNVDATSHQVVADDGTFASVALKTNDTYSFTFAKSGDFRYHDTFTRAKGEVVVTAAPAPTPTSVSLTASRGSVVYGGSLTLSGKVSSGAAGQSVTLSADEAGSSKSVQTVDTTTTTAGGAFSFDVSPSIRTAYKVESGSASSRTVTVFVAPRVTLVRNSHGIFTTRAVSDLSYNGHTVLFQRLQRNGTWRTVKFVQLRGGGIARFVARLPHGRNYVRVWMTAGQAGFGYLAGHSGVLIVRR
jgi:plastocyanin